MKKISIDKIINIFISLLIVILSVFLIIKIHDLNIIPTKYIVLIIISLIILNIVAIFFIFSKHKTLKIIGFILSILIIIFDMVSNYYVKTTDKFLNKSFMKVNIKKEITKSYNIYIGGVDFTESIYDFNTIISFNEKTNKMLLISIPRDYHINIPKFNMDDNLSYIGINGIDQAINSLENLFNTKIDYYIDINTNSLVELVDILGGLEYCSDEEFVTTHSKVLGTYNDKYGSKLYVKKGCKNYSGIEILTIARERLHITGGDTKRQKNCQKILINLFNKILSFDTLTNYEEVLNKIDNLYETNIPREIVVNLIKNKLDNKLNIDIETINLYGTTTKGYVRLGTIYDYIMIPNNEIVESTKTKLNENLTK